MFFVSKLTEHRKLFRLGKYKKSPAKRVSLPRTNKQIIYPRCHLDSQHTLRRLAGYQHIPGNSRIPTRCRILRKNPFPCTLSGPFDNLFLTRFSASRVLCKGIVAVISTSTVYNIQLLRTDFTRKYKSCQAKKSYGNISCIFFAISCMEKSAFRLKCLFSLKTISANITLSAVHPLLPSLRYRKKLEEPLSLLH